ncbi:hypothetical protein AB0I10_37760 [Streptomyces sp. NPDC050636]|uniref:hypothetical protein n=1 Tax=Streptomyces sp. NPDC050636 TaxID=3154510 RepID=UPI00341994A5
MGIVQLRAEFTTEPYELDKAPAHAVVARDVIQAENSTPSTSARAGVFHRGRPDGAGTGQDAREAIRPHPSLRGRDEVVDRLDDQRELLLLARQAERQRLAGDLRSLLSQQRHDQVLAA